MGKVVVIVIDSLGIGAMDDVKKDRPQDINANTCKHILESKPDLSLSNLEEMGLINALGEKVNTMKKKPQANYGRMKLAHYGGDTFFGHQEIMGSKPQKPLIMPFKERIDIVEKALQKEGYEVMRRGKKYQYLLVEGAVTIGDNLEADLGQVYNLTAALSYIDYQRVLDIAKVVRASVQVARVIAFGGEGVTISEIEGAVEVKNDCYVGINAPKSGVYKRGYQVRHLGYGVDSKTQIQTLLRKEGIETILIGKVADIVDNLGGKNYLGIVDTGKVLKLTLEELNQQGDSFICVNIQETDLAGHNEDTASYIEKLQIVDKYLGKIKLMIGKKDLLIVTADHGNDPTIGHSKHTREYVPLLVYNPQINGINIGTRESLADIAATVSEFFNAGKVEAGESFFKLLKL